MDDCLECKKIKVHGSEIIVERPSYDDAYFYYKGHVRNYELFHSIVRTYVVKYDEEHYDVIEDFLKSYHAGDDGIYISESKMALYHHCRIHDKYKANPNRYIFHFLNLKDLNIVVSKLLKIEDDQCLAAVMNYISIIFDLECLKIENGRDICRYIEYFLKDYKDENCKKVYNAISNSFTKYGSQGLGKRVYDLANVFAYRLKLQYKDMKVDIFDDFDRKLNETSENKENYLFDEKGECTKIVDNKICTITIPNTEDVKFYLKKKGNNSDFLFDRTYVIKHTKDTQDIIKKMRNIDKYHEYVDENLMKLYHHCRIHNEYDANPRENVNKFLLGSNSELVISKLIEIDDDQCLSVLFDFLSILSSKQKRIRKMEKVVCMIIDFFIRDYHNADCKKLYNNMAERYRIEKNYKLSDDLIDMTYVNLYRMFLQYDDDLVFINDLNGDKSPVRLRNDNMYYRSDENSEDKKLCKRKINENYKKYHANVNWMDL